MWSFPDLDAAYPETVTNATSARMQALVILARYIRKHRNTDVSGIAGMQSGVSQDTKLRGALSRNAFAAV
jgi:hypothetical protein